MSAPLVQAVGTPVKGTGDIVVAWPAGHAVNDIGVLIVEHANQAPSAPAGWTQFASTGTGTAGAAAADGVTCFWKRAASAAEASVTVADTGTRQIGVILVFRGCIATGSPIDVVTTNFQATVSASATIPGVTTSLNDDLLVGILTNSLGVTTPTVRPATVVNTSLQNLVKRLNTQPDGTGGGVVTNGFLPIGMFSFGSGGADGDVGEGVDLTTAKPCTACMFVPNINTIGAQIDVADTKNILLILNLAGNKASYTVTVNGKPTLDMAKYESNVRRFRPDADNTSFADRLKLADAIRRRRVICYVVDEPNLNTGTVPNVPNISPAETNQMALLHKAIWSGYQPLTLVRVPAETMASGWNGLPKPSGGWTGVDYCWSQYTIRHGRGATVSQPWATPVNPQDVIDEQRAIIAANNLNMGVAVSLNVWAGGIGNDAPFGVTAKWDTDGPGGSSTTGWVTGTRDNGPTVITTGTSPATSIKSVIANPNFIAKFAEITAQDPEVPFCLFWQHVDPGAAADEYISYYQRADYRAAFNAAIDFGLARTSFSGWRTAK